MKQMCLGIALVGLLCGGVAPAQAVTVYLKDGTQLEVEKVTRLGNSVCLMLDVSQIDTARTKIEDWADEVKIRQEGLVVANVDFALSTDNTEIIGTGKVVNHTAAPVKNVQVLAILKDRKENVLLRVRGYVQPEVLAPGQTGEYRFHVKKPENFASASVEVQGEGVQQPPKAVE